MASDDDADADAFQEMLIEAVCVFAPETAQVRMAKPDRNE